MRQSQTGTDTSFPKYFLPVAAVALLLRVWGIWEMPFTNDEMSAYNRLHFGSIGALIQGGVLPDTHPALVHVFLWIFKHLFGFEAWAVKLPFIMASLGGLYFSFRLAWHTLGRQPAMFAGLIMAASQPFLYFSTVARPYATGWLITSALAWVWYQVVFRQRWEWKWSVWMALLLALSVYNHYFSGMLAILIWFTGLPFLKTDQFKAYIGAAFGAGLLFLPHLRVSLVQVGYGGIGGAEGYLDAPDRWFFWDWLVSIFNHSEVPAILALLMLLIGVAGILSVKTSNSLYIRIFAGWFLFVFVFSFVYSHLVNPLLHHGALFFSSPFFIMAFCGSIRLSPKISAVAATLLTMILGYHLIAIRQHFPTMQRQPYAGVAADLAHIHKQGIKAIAYIHQMPGSMNYYIATDTLSYPVVNTHLGFPPIGSIVEHIIASEANYLYTDGRNLPLVSAATIRFHYAYRTEGYTWSGHHFSTVPLQGFQALPERTLISNTEAHTGATEYFELCHLHFDTMEVSFADEISATIVFQIPDSSFLASSPEMYLAFDLFRGEERLHWSAAALIPDAFVHNGMLYLTYRRRLWDDFTAYRQMKGAHLKIYLWNRALAPFSISRFSVTHTEGNPMYYSQLLRRP